MATNLKVTELDFADIKENLKAFLKQQTEFNDYDFDGSGMSVLLDVLAYNTHYNAMNAHFALNEAFLDSAQIFECCTKMEGNILDFGTGAGFPGLVLAIMGIKNIHLVDSNKKNVIF